jgi:flagellar assembly factor FliW
MKINSTRFGEIEINEDTIINFEKGILGFPKNKQFVLLDTDDTSPFKWLQSVENPNLAFVVTNPTLFVTDYQIDVEKNEMKDINVDNPDDVIILVLVTVPEDPSKMTANFKGPLIVNKNNRKGKQIIVDNPKFDIKFRLIPDNFIEEVV